MIPPPAAHLRPEQVTDLLAGLLGTPDEAAVRDHLSACTECAELPGRLAQLQALLATEGASPIAIPPDVASRIDTALAEQYEPQFVGARVRSLHPVRRSKSSPDAPRRKTAWLPRALVAAASVAVLGGAVAVALNQDGSETGADVAFSPAEGSAPSEFDGPIKDEAAASPKFEAGSGAPPELLRLDRGQFDEQVAAALTAPETVEGLSEGRSSAPRSGRIVNACVADALGPRAGARWSAYAAELDGQPVSLVVQAAKAAPRKVWALDCTGAPEPVAMTRLP